MFTSLTLLLFLLLCLTANQIIAQCGFNPNWTHYNETCLDYNDGQICCSPSGGTGPFSCTISPVAGTQVGSCFVGLPPSTTPYTVTITDGNGCQLPGVFTIIGNDYPAVVITPSSVPSCGGSGSACVSVTGGSGVFNIDWFSDSGFVNYIGSGNCITQSAGTYWYRVEDTTPNVPFTECVNSGPVTIASASLTLGPVIPHSATCIEPCNGAIEIDLSTVLLPATISWTGTSSGTTVATATPFWINGLCPGTYAVSADDASSCTPVTISALVVGTDNGDFTVYNGQNIVWTSANFSGQTDVTLGGNVIVQGGGSLEISNMTIRLKPGRHITVKSHGILTADNVIFDAGCGDTWAGFRIEALGNTACDATTNRGYLELTNCTVTHADIGIANYAYTGANNGGRIHLSNSTFLNNQRDLNLLNYSTANNATQDEYGGLFENCDFVTTLIPHGTGTFKQVRINLNSINDVRFLECNMTNIAPGWFGNGFPTGVRSDFAQFQWLGNNNSVISGYGRGIRADGDYTNPTCGVGYTVSNDVVESEFHCISSIFLNNAIRCQIYLNDIHPQPAMYPSPTASIYTGIQVQNTSTANGMEFRILDNDVEFAGVGNVRRGIAIEHTRGLTNYIVRNHLTNCNDGLLLLGRNRNATSADGMGGTHFECNIFHSCARDINVTCSTGCSTAETGVADRQENTFNNLLGPFGLSAGNDFTDSQNVGNVQDDINAGVAPATGTMNGFHYRYHPNDYPTVNYDAVNDKPDESSVFDPVIQPYLSVNAPFNIVIPHKQLGQLSPFCSNIAYPIPSFPVILQNLNSAKASYNSLHALYETLLDGGNTEELKQNVLLAQYAQAMNLYQSLLAESPALSDEVMLAAIQKENELPASLLTMILAANPSSAKSAQIWNAIEMRSIPLDSYQKAQIKLGYGVSTPKEMMEDDMGLMLAGIDEAIHNAMRYLANNNSTEGIGMISELLDPAIYEHDRSLAYVEMQSGDFQNGINRLKSLGERHAIDSELSQHFIDLVPLIQVHHDAVNREIPLLTSQEKTFLFDIRDNDPCGLSRYANDLLVSYGNEESVEVDCIEQRSMFKRKDAEKQQFVSLFPNPADADYSILRLIEPANQDIRINLYGSDGSLFASSIMKIGQRDFVIDLTGAASGVYQMTVTSDTVIQSLTLIKL